MEAIVRADGRQMRVTEGMEFETNRVSGQAGDMVTFEVLMILDGDDCTVGAPVVEGAAVTARIKAHTLGPKLRFIKYKNKVRYRRTLGHRQPITRLVVESISRG